MAHSHSAHEFADHRPVARRHARLHDVHAWPREAHAGHDKHAGHSVAMFREQVLDLAAPDDSHARLGRDDPARARLHAARAFPASRWIPAVFGTAVFLYGGWVFLQGAWRELARPPPGMMTLISLAITVAFVFSVAVTLGFPRMPLWWELATLVTIMLLGHWMEMRSITQAQGALKELAKLLPERRDARRRRAPGRA